MKQIFNQSEALPRCGQCCVISMELLHWFLRRRYMGKQVGVSQNVGCFLRLTGSINQLSELRKDSLGDHVLNFQLIVKRL